ncbi:MAG: hypothetical protein HYV78_00915 [Candidatus Wildermuthbacteria bacterium]|nr:hypothetical protein [Candidatus Wildermuthbacteria bacterium]
MSILPAWCLRGSSVWGTDANTVISAFQITGLLKRTIPTRHALKENARTPQQHAPMEKNQAQTSAMRLLPLSAVRLGTGTNALILTVLAAARLISLKTAAVTHATQQTLMSVSWNRGTTQKSGLEGLLRTTSWST